MADSQANQEGKRVRDSFINRVALSLGIRSDLGKQKLAKSIENEQNKSALQGFLREKDFSTVLFIVPGGSDSVQLSIELPQLDKFKKKSVVAFRISYYPLTKESSDKEILLLQITRNILQHLYVMFNDVMGPVMQNPDNQVGWTDLITKDLMEKFNNYIAQVYVILGLNKGRTLLPLPNPKLTSSENVSDQDKAHVFQGSIITWTKQIKNVLQMQPEQALKLGQDPGPLTELQFWKNQADNLNSIYNQLQSIQVQNILRFLQGNKSTYTQPFTQLQKQVKQARTQANNNNVYLAVLQQNFERLSNGVPADFTTMHELFIPIMHGILQISESSKYYNTPPRLVVIIREICNAIISRAMEYVSGDTIFSHINSEETGEACDKLQITIDICTQFQQAYLQYQSRAQQPWKVTNNAIFVRLDSFLERCNDILHLTNTIMQFNKLSRIEMGGTKGKTLTENVVQIYTEFQGAVETFTKVQYDIMDISKKEFDDDFYEFRSKIKELERRLASVITASFDDYDSLYGRFKVLDTFEGLLTRPIIQDELQKKHIVILDMYKQDLKQVQSIFLQGKELIDQSHDHGPVFANMPPIAGALTWCKSLTERIREPMDKLATLGQGIAQREEYKDVHKLHNSIKNSINDYEAAKIKSWEGEVQKNTNEKLNQPLLVKLQDGKLKVNFDAVLVCLLREVKYLKLLGRTVPETAEKLFSQAETYRKQIVSLELIVQNYNFIITCLHPVQEPLVSKRIKDMETALLPGIEEFKWRNEKEKIDQFIVKSKQIVDALYDIVKKMLDSLKKIRDSLQKFNVKIIERRNKPSSPDEYDSYLKAIFVNKLNTVKEQGQLIHKQLKEVLDSVKADKKGPAWRNYNDYVNTIVIDGLSTSIQTALQHLNEQLLCNPHKKDPHGPLFDVKLELNENVSFDPQIGETTTPIITVRNIIRNWINDFFTIASFVNRLDTTLPGDYLQEVKNYFEIRECQATISQNLDTIQENCNDFRKQFDEYAYLWRNDPQKSFEDFLVNNEPKDEPKDLNDQDSQAGTVSKENPLLKNCRAQIPNLELFDEEITRLKAVQQSIEKITTPVDIYWLRVNIQPLKTALERRVKEWVQVYTGFLVSEFKQTLKNFKVFIDKTSDGIKSNPADEENQGDQNLLMKVMRTISQMKDVEPKTESIFQRMKDMVAKLKKHNVPIFERKEDDPMQSIDNVKTSFIETSGQVFQVKADIIQFKDQEAQKLKEKLREFNDSVNAFRAQFLQELPFSYNDSMTMEQINDSYVMITQYYNELKKIEAKALQYNALEKLFELQKSNYKAIKDCASDLKSLKTMWDAIAMVNYQYNDWMGKQWRHIKADIFQEINKTLATQLKGLPKEIRNYKGYNVIVDKVKNMGTVLPLISALHSEFMEDRHWDQVRTLTGVQFDQKSQAFTFQSVIGLQLYKFEAAINEIVDIAQKENKIEKKLKTIESNWNKQVFEFDEYKETQIFQSTETMMELLDQNSLDLMGMRSQGQYVEFFLNIVEDWREKLGRVDTVVNEWLKVQKNWRVLVNIFLASEDIRMQLPEDTKTFEGVDNDFRMMMYEAFAQPNVVEACTNERGDVLKDLSAKINKCEKALNDYLEQKKKAFPRFYFLSNQSLLTILSNGQNCPQVCQYLGDCFDGLKTIRFLPPKNAGDWPKQADAMYSQDDEIIPFPSNFFCEGAVESWLLKLELKMRESLYEVLKDAKNTSELWDTGDKPREDWVEGYCAQIALLTTQIVWTEDVTRAFDELQGGSESAMKEALELIRARLKGLINKVRLDLTNIERWKIINIITIDVHSRDVVEKFVISKVSEAESFWWLAQLKFFWENRPDSDMAQRQALRYPWETDKNAMKCIIRIVDWYRFYTFEYVGNAIRLVVTPLTDRCYITLTQAMNLTMGGAPAGPAGTGKTQTTKDLGRGCGIYVVVFNCSDQMNQDSMAQIFMGLAQSGSWGCFDEFNRISIEVLSVVSTQVKTVLDALKEKKTRFVFTEEGQIGLLDTVGFFITMNPGYAGRTELPENLKALFRSCAMVVPDLVLICENMLMSEGFTQARDLSRQFVSLYMLSRELLSKQKHYDWGLRAVKSVLRQAGKLKRSDPDIPEDPLLMRALRDFNLPKIVTDDKPIFLRLIGDLFPRVQCPPQTDPHFTQIVSETTVQDMGLIAEDAFVIQVVQLAEILEVRHCCFVIGPPGCGQTAVWKTLVRSHINNQQECQFDTLNPKAVTSDELFGAYTKSKEWKNGVLSVIMRNQVKNEDKYRQHQSHKWSVLDGDIDPEWIESLNTVMDDNKVLTLVSNDRIPLSPAMRLLFEVSNLKNATPATVSRAGVLFINDTDIGWMPFMNSWLDRSTINKLRGTRDGANLPEVFPAIDDVAKSTFLRCFQTYFVESPDIHDKTKVRHIAPMVDIGMVISICTILDALLLDYGDQVKTLQEDDQKLTYENFFVFAGMWGIGGGVGGGQEDEKDLQDFNSLWKSLAKNSKLPEAGLCYDYFFDVVEQKWQSWNQKMTPYLPSDSAIPPLFSKIYVSTLHTTRLRYMLDIHLKRRQPIMFVGSAGTGQTAVIKDYLSSTNSSLVAHKTINFSSFTDSYALQKNIQSMVQKKSGKTFGSATNQVLICFIDDLNMPKVDKYGTQSPIQLLRLIIDHGSIFNRELLEQRQFLQDLLFFACQNHKSGSFVIDGRLQRNFTIFTMYTPNQDVIKTIFGSILNAHLNTVDEKLQKLTDKFIDATIFVFQKILKDSLHFSPSAKKFHYQFNFRELSRVVEGMCRSTQQRYKGKFEDLVRLWCHEMKRTFEDRLINEVDISFFRQFLNDGCQNFLYEPTQANNPMAEPLVFTQFIPLHYGDDLCYVMTDLNELKKVLDEKLNDYNDVKPVMNLVLFQQAMQHIARISRILQMPGNNALLVGVGGSGKQSLARLSAFISGFDIDQLVVTASYTMNDLRNSLQEIYKKIAQPNGNPRVFMLTDSQIKQETFLIPINDMLNSGWVFDLFPKEDFDGMVSNVRNEAKAAGIFADNIDMLTTFFLDKIRRNLQVVLCFSPVGDTMRVRSRRFPGIINSTSVDWFHPWPKDALINVAYRFIKDIEFPTDQLRQTIALCMAEMHISIDQANMRYLKFQRRYNYTTPKSFLELIDFYKQLLKEKRESIDSQINKYQSGLNILAETQGKVQGLQKELGVMMVEVDKQKADTDVLIQKVSHESTIAEEEQTIANEEEVKTNQAAQVAEAAASQADQALKEAIPALQQAEAAVDCLKKPNIQEMKSMGSPPAGVFLTARVVLILFGEKISLNDPDDKVWKKAQLSMNNPEQFIQRVKNYNGQTIEQNILDTVNKILNDPAQQFTEKDMAGQSYAASKLCAWAVNIVIFNKIFKQVKPLVEEQQRALAELQAKKRDLAIVKQRVRVLNEKVAALKRDLDKAIVQKEEVEAKANACLAKLNAAEKLVNGLAGENQRWNENVKYLKQNILCVIGDSLLASSFVSYIAAFSAQIRSDLWRKTWLPDIIAKQIPMTQGIEPLKILTTEGQQAQWQSEGLPADPMSLENAAVISSCSRWPLIIDPQLQGSIWIRGKQGENLTTISVNQNKWLPSLVQAITVGKSVLLEGIQQEIDATLDPLLQRAIIKRGRNFILEMGGDQIDYDPNFKLFLMTKLYNPHFRPEIAAQCTIINFIVTQSGLEEQLLAQVVNQQRNELEQKKQELVKLQNDFSVRLEQLETNLLEALSSANPATILENKELIENLDITKRTTIEIQEQSEKAKLTEIQINTQREIYRPVAAEGAMLYFLVIQLNFMEFMYQYSLQAFTTFFFKAIYKTQEKGEERIGALILKIRYIIYQWISRGLFERHKLIFLTLITFRLMIKKQLPDVVWEPAEMDFLIKCGTKPGTQNILDWLPNLAWDSVMGLIDLQEFRAFGQNLKIDAPNRFKDWYNEQTPEDQKLPLDWKKLDQMPFQKLLVIRCLRPDRMAIALSQFIKEVLPQGDQFLEMDSKLSFTQVLQSAVEDAESTNPIFFILSPGADPVKEVEKIAKKKKIQRGKTFFSLALGEGQDQVAEKKIEEGYKEGHWVMLENIHLMPRWLIELEKILDFYGGEAGGGSSNFRLFLSAEPSPGIPIGLLDRSIKLTNEPPAGLKANMKKAWTFYSKEEIQDKDPKIKSIFFALCFFHSTMLERKRFGPKGWNMTYPFSMGDLRDSYLVMNRYMEQNSGGQVPWDDLIYIFGEIMYGGHIVDDWDRRLCNNYLYNIMHDGLWDELELFPFCEGQGFSFQVPGQNPYEKYVEHIEQSLTVETPLAYGFHPNAQIGFRTTQCTNIFNALLELMPKDANTSESKGEVKSPQDLTMEMIQYLLQDMNIKDKIFNIDDIKNKMDAENKGPYQNVFLQEIEYMNALLMEIVRSMEEIQQGINGLLTITEQMESIIDSIALFRVPAQWSLLAYPSKRGLASWLANLFQRIEQLNLFKDDPYNIPQVVMISRFFNPQSFLTAIMQVIGRIKSYELNKLYIQTEITQQSIEEIEGSAQEGAYVFGFILQGARWDIQSSQLEESRPKEMFSILPVVYCQAMPVPPEGKEDQSLYQCPTYKTQDRGNTYVFTAQLKTRYPPRQWILAGVAIIMDVEGVSDIATSQEQQEK